MRKTVISILLVVALLLSVTYAGAEKSFEEMDKEYDQLMESWKRTEAVSKVLKNGLPTYPKGSYNDEYAFDSLVELPNITEENYKDYVGTTYLLTGTCLEEKAFGCKFQLDDGRVLLVSFSIRNDGKYTSLLPTPPEGKRCNLFCTFNSWYHDSWNKADLNFQASVTELAVQNALKRLDY
jgi:hypothetical protein